MEVQMISSQVKNEEKGQSEKSREIEMLRSELDAAQQRVGIKDTEIQRLQKDIG